MKHLLTKVRILLCCLLWLSVLSCACEVLARPEQVYSIQASSLLLKEEALSQYNALEKAIPQHDDLSLRVEYVEPYFTVRIGRFTHIAPAKELLAHIQGEIPEAIVVKCTFDQERIVSTNDQLLRTEPKRSQDAPQVVDLDLATPPPVPEATKSAPSPPDSVPNVAHAKAEKTFPQLNYPPPAAGTPRKTLTTSKTVFLTTLPFLGMLAYAFYARRKHAIVSDARDPQLAEYAKLARLRPRIVAHFADNPPTCIADVVQKIEEFSGDKFTASAIKKFIKTLRTDA